MSKYHFVLWLTAMLLTLITVGIIGVVYVEHRHIQLKTAAEIEVKKASALAAAEVEKTRIASEAKLSATTISEVEATKRTKERWSFVPWGRSEVK